MRWGRRPLLPFVIVLVVYAPVAFAQEATDPQITLGQAQVVSGDQLQVRGSGFTPQDLVTLELCGNGALDASVDCDVRGASEFAVRVTGEFFGVLTVRVPPRACPCVVRVTSSGDLGEIREPVEVTDAPFSQAAQRVPQPDISRQLTISDFEIENHGVLAGLLGARVERTAHLRITNTGSAPIQAPGISLTYGRGSDPTEVIPVPEVGVVEVGRPVELSVPFSLDAMSFGRYTVRASIGGLGEPLVARAETSTYPWGLVAAGLVCLQLALLRLRNRVRRRIVAGLEDTETNLGAGALRTTAELDEPVQLVHVSAEPVLEVMPEVSSEPGPSHGAPPADLVEAAAGNGGWELEPAGSAVLGSSHREKQPRELVEWPDDGASSSPHDVRQALESLDRLAARLRQESDIALTGHFEAAEALAASVRDVSALEAAAIRAEAKSGSDDMARLLREVSEQAKASIEEVSVRSAELSDEIVAACAGSTDRLGEARQRADDLLSIAEREVAAVRADSDELRCDEQARLALLREEADEVVRSLRRQVDEATATVNRNVEELTARITSRSQAALDRVELREQMLRDQVVEAAVAMIKDVASGVVRAAFERSSVSDTGGPGPERIIDLTEDSRPAAQRPDDAAQVVEHAPGSAKDALGGAIHRAVRRSLSS